MKKELPDQEELRKWFYFDGRNLVWKMPRKGVTVGKIAGSLSGDGYWQVVFDGSTWKAHRLIWVYVNGSIPENMEVDHINAVKTDNRIENLRLATRKENGRNLHNRAAGVSGVRGVYLHNSGKYYSQIRIDGRPVHLGYFDSKEEASRARKEAEKEYYGEFSPYFATPTRFS